MVTISFVLNFHCRYACRHIIGSPAVVAALAELFVLNWRCDFNALLTVLYPSSVTHCSCKRSQPLCCSMCQEFHLHLCSKCPVSSSSWFPLLPTSTTHGFSSSALLKVTSGWPLVEHNLSQVPVCHVCLDFHTSSLAQRTVFGWLDFHLTSTHSGLWTGLHTPGVSQRGPPSFGGV